MFTVVVYHNFFWAFLLCLFLIRQRSIHTRIWQHTVSGIVFIHWISHQFSLKHFWNQKAMNFPFELCFSLFAAFGCRLCVFGFCVVRLIWADELSALNVWKYSQGSRFQLFLARVITAFYISFNWLFYVYDVSFFLKWNSIYDAEGWTRKTAMKKKSSKWHSKLLHLPMSERLRLARYRCLTFELFLLSHRVRNIFVMVA